MQSETILKHTISEWFILDNFNIHPNFPAQNIMTNSSALCLMNSCLILDLVTSCWSCFLILIKKHKQTYNKKPTAFEQHYPW